MKEMNMVEYIDCKCLRNWLDSKSNMKVLALTFTLLSSLIKMIDELKLKETINKRL